MGLAFMIIELGMLVTDLLVKGLITAKRVREVFAKYPANPTAEDIKAVEKDLLRQALHPLPRTDARVQEILKALGKTPEDIGI